MVETFEPPPHHLANLTALHLDEFVAYVDKIGGPISPAFSNLAKGFFYTPEVKVDQALDPFSETYCDQMIELYRELSGRDLDQETGEITTIDVAHHAASANPYASRNIAFISKHARAVLTATMMANLPSAAKVLDLGCGWGLSTEMLEFTGAHVTAVDINSDFVELVERRSKRRLSETRIIKSNFDSLNLAESYDMAFFYECLHHAVRPWETLKHISTFVVPNGRIVFAGEPINEFWWKNWGLRLDPLSLYCIRKFGWFESGWSKSFLRAMFDKIGWELQLVDGVGLDGGIIGFAHRRGADGVRPLGPVYEVA
ncbi:MAG: class I SAM-dependent methyltransferase [Roseomonas sp.]|nr:class I SAM-dependent methyltransferase [Roseomonas sp.]